MVRHVDINQYEQRQDLRLSGTLSQRIALEGAKQTHNLDFIKGIERGASKNLKGSYNQAAKAYGNVQAQNKALNQKEAIGLYNRRVEAINKIQRNNDVNFGLIPQPTGTNDMFYSKGYLKGSDATSRLPSSYRDRYGNLLGKPQRPVSKPVERGKMFGGFPAGTPPKPKLDSDSLKRMFHMPGFE